MQTGAPGIINGLRGSHPAVPGACMCAWCPGLCLGFTLLVRRLSFDGGRIRICKYIVGIYRYIRTPGYRTVYIGAHAIWARPYFAAVVQLA